MTEPEARARLSDLLFGYRISQATAVAASLGVADHLAAGPRGAAELATDLACDATALYRLLRLIAAAGVLHEDRERRFSLTPVGALLRSDVPGSMREPATLQGSPEIHAGVWRFTSRISDGLKTR